MLVLARKRTITMIDLMTPNGEKLKFFMLAVKFYTDTQPFISSGSFVFQTVDSDFTVHKILEKIRLPAGWKMKELMPYPVEMHAFEYASFKGREPKSVFDFTQTGEIVIRAEDI